MSKLYATTDNGVDSLQFIGPIVRFLGSIAYSYYILFVSFSS